MFYWDKLEGVSAIDLGRFVQVIEVFKSADRSIMTEVCYEGYDGLYFSEPVQRFHIPSNDLFG